MFWNNNSNIITSVRKSSAKIHAVAHISIAVVNLGDPNKTSGALYQSVTTLAVIFFGGTPKKRAKPKSA